MDEQIELLSKELKRYPSRRRKKVLRLATPKLISDIESEILKINLYLTTVISNGHKANNGDEYQPMRERVKYLMDLVKKIKSI